MSRLIPIKSLNDILPQYRNTPIGNLLEYHNLNKEHAIYERAELLVGMCMDNRKHLRMPDNFAYIIRSGGANLRFSEFKVSYAIAVGEVKHLVLIGHNNCGMVNIVSRRDQFINGLVEFGGWELDFAEEHFNSYAPLFETGNEVDFVIAEAQRIRNRYPKITVAPLFYQVEDGLLYQVKED